MNDTLKDTHPQKYYLKLLCKVIFYLGLGTYWYEVEKTRYPRLYAVWCLLINGFVALGTLDKLLAISLSHVSDDAKSDIIQTEYAEVVIILKICVLILKKERVRIFLKRILEDHRDIFTSTELEAKAMTRAKGLSYLYWFGAYAYLSVLFSQMIIVGFKEGTPLQTHLTYFPTSAYVGFSFDLLRILVIGHLWVLVSMMVATDCLCIMSLIFLAAKLRQVQMFFEIKGDISEKHCNAEGFKKRVISSGIKLHETALGCARDVQSALGYIYGAQICLTIVLLGLRLLQVANSERTLLNLIGSMLFLLNVSWITGCYMITSGEITHEAAGVATAVFHCGWERGRSRGARALFVVAMQRAQQPVLMTAFGFFIMSHENFVNVLRSAYSFFAVVY